MKLMLDEIRKIYRFDNLDEFKDFMNDIPIPEGFCFKEVQPVIKVDIIDVPAFGEKIDTVISRICTAVEITYQSRM